MTPSTPSSESQIKSLEAQVRSLRELNQRLLDDLKYVRKERNALQEKLEERTVESQRLRNLNTKLAAAHPDKTKAAAGAASVDEDVSVDKELLNSLHIALAERDALEAKINELKKSIAGFSDPAIVAMIAAMLDAMVCMARVSADMNNLVVPATVPTTDHFAEMFRGRFTLEGKKSLRQLMKEVHGQAITHAVTAIQSKAEIDELKEAEKKSATEIARLKQEHTAAKTAHSAVERANHALQENIAKLTSQLAQEKLKKQAAEASASHALIAATELRALKAEQRVIDIELETQLTLKAVSASLIGAETKAIIAKFQVEAAEVKARELESEASTALLFKTAECTALRQQLERAQADIDNLCLAQMPLTDNTAAVRDAWSISQLLGTRLLETLNICDTKPQGIFSGNKSSNNTPNSTPTPNA